MSSFLQVSLKLSERWQVPADERCGRVGRACVARCTLEVRVSCSTNVQTLSCCRPSIQPVDAVRRPEPAAGPGAIAMTASKSASVIEPPPWPSSTHCHFEKIVAVQESPGLLFSTTVRTSESQGRAAPADERRCACHATDQRTNVTLEISNRGYPAGRFSEPLLAETTRLYDGDQAPAPTVQSQGKVLPAQSRRAAATAPHRPDVDVGKKASEQLFAVDREQRAPTETSAVAPSPETQADAQTSPVRKPLPRDSRQKG